MQKFIFIKSFLFSSFFFSVKKPRTLLFRAFLLFYKKINLQKLKKLEKIRKKFKILRKLYTLLKSVKYSKSGKGLEVHEVATGLTSRNDKKELP